MLYILSARVCGLYNVNQIVCWMNEFDKKGELKDKLMCVQNIYIRTMIKYMWKKIDVVPVEI